MRYFKPHPEQGKFIESCFNNRESWAFCGNRGGKTEGGAAATASMATGVKIGGVNSNWVHRGGSIHWVCSVSNEVQREVTQPKIIKWLPKDKIDKVTNIARGIIDFITLKDGSRIVFKNYEQGVDKFGGADVDSVWFDEEPPQDIYKESLMRTIDRAGHVFGTLTPVKGLTWIYKDIYKKRDVRNIFVFGWSMDDNPYISDKEKGAILAGLTEDERNIRQKGQFVALHGLVYPQFNREIHCRERFEIPEDWRKIIGLDPHLKKPMSAVWMTRAGYDHKYVKRGDWIVYREMRKSGVIPDVVAAINVASGRERIFTRIADPALNIKTDNFKGLDVFAEFAGQRFPLLPANKSVFPGIQQIRKLLEAKPPAFWVFDNCMGTVDEFEQYIFSDVGGDYTKNYSEKIRKQNDDYLDPIRYIINSGIKAVGRNGDSGFTNKYTYTESGRMVRKRGHNFVG